MLWREGHGAVLALPLIAHHMLDRTETHLYYVCLCLLLSKMQGSLIDSNISTYLQCVRACEDVFSVIK